MLKSFWQDTDLVKSYVSKIQELEGELLRLQKSNTSKRSELVDYHDFDVDGLHPKNSLFAVSDTKTAETDGKFFQLLRNSLFYRVHGFLVLAVLSHEQVLTQRTSFILSYG